MNGEAIKNEWDDTQQTSYFCSIETTLWELPPRVEARHEFTKWLVSHTKNFFYPQGLIYESELWVDLFHKFALLDFFSSSSLNAGSRSELRCTAHAMNVCKEDTLAKHQKEMRQQVNEVKTSLSCVVCVPKQRTRHKHDTTQQHSHALCSLLTSSSWV